MHAVFVSKPRYALPLLPLLVVGGLAGLALLGTALAPVAAPSLPTT